MTREEKLQKAHQMFDNRNLLIELKWQKEYFKRGYVSKQEELFNLWIFDECIKALEQEPRKGHWLKIKPYPLQMHEYECSECGHETDDNTESYCSDCGAKMVQPQESEE